MTTVSTVVMADTFTSASISYSALMPMLIVFVVALAEVLVAGFATRESRHALQVGLSLIGLLGALAALLLGARFHQGVTASVADAAGSRQLGAVVVDGPTIFLQAGVLVLALLAVLIMSERLGGIGADAFTPMGAANPGSVQERAAQRAGLTTSEAFPLLMLAVGGMMLFVAAGDLLTLFVGLEVLSLPLYILTGLARRRRLLSQEAALKYFLLGAFSSAFLLFGAALLYGYAGSVYLSEIASAISAGQPDREALLVPGVLLVLVGLLFKVGAVPFHSWTPDVYQGAPTPVTGFMAACTKLAAFGAMLRVVYVGAAGDRWNWSVVVVVIAALTMIVGAVMSVTQTDVKRLLAYSSIAHAGFILTGVLAFDVTGVSAVMFYLVTYGLTTIAAFGIVYLVRDVQSGSEATHLSQWAGLGRKHPVAAATFAFLMLAFAGIPLTSGFVAKLGAFGAAVGHGGASGAVLAVIGVLSSAITVFVYVRIIVMMYFTEPAENAVEVVSPSILAKVAIGFCAVLTLALGIAPKLLLDWAANASLFLS